MHEFEEPAEQAPLSRTEIELELARIALVVIRSSEAAAGARTATPPSLVELGNRLLARVRPQHRRMVENRLLELARSLSAGEGHADHEWLNVSMPVPGANAGAPRHPRR